MPGAQLRFLQSQADVRPAREMLAQLFGLMTNNYDHDAGFSDSAAPAT